MNRTDTLLVMVCLAVLLNTTAVEAGRVWLVKEGQPAADVYAGSPEWGTAEKLVRRIETWTGVKLILFGPTAQPPGRKTMARVLIGTAESSDEMKRLVGDDPAYRTLNEQGYLLRATKAPNLVIVAGRSHAGTFPGVGELLNYRLEVDAKNVWVEPFEAAEQPALPYRWFWLSTSFTHWDASYGSPHMTDEAQRVFGTHPDGQPIGPGGYPGQMMGPDAYRRTYETMIDWMCEHKINGAMIFGLLQNYNGGVEAARSLAQYGRRRGVDIIAGVGTMGYWGAYYGGTNEFNLDTLPKLRPDLYITHEDGRQYLCPSRPEVQAYWESAAEWIARAVPELSGLYLENGDLAVCPCQQCKSARAKPGNDTGCYWDMMASSQPFIQTCTGIHPDWKIVYAVYTSFLPDGLRTGTAHAQPRFPEQLPAEAICQWTVTGLDENSWPDGAGAATAQSVGLFHSPSVWGQPAQADRWWAGPGSSHDDASHPVRFYCQRMASSGLEGLVVKGMKSKHSPGPLLTYLALGEFSFHPERTIKEWETTRLNRLFGGSELATHYLRIARATTTDTQELQQLIGEAQQVAGDAQLSPRARPYWKDLEQEMRYRLRLRQALDANQAKGVE